jgi:tetratricopeptide (TPR) repeat protein
MSFGTPFLFLHQTSGDPQMRPTSFHTPASPRLAPVAPSVSGEQPTTATAEEAAQARLDAIQAAFESGHVDQALILEASVLMVKCGQRKQAIALVEQSMKRWPKFLPLADRLVELLLQDGQPRKAFHVLKESAELRKTVLRVARTRGEADPRGTTFMSHYLRSALMLARGNAALLRDLLKIVDKEHASVNPSAAANFNASRLAVRAAALYALGRREEANAELATINPPDDNTVFALAHMGRLEEAFELLARREPPCLDAVAHQRVWSIPLLDRLLKNAPQEILVAYGVQSLVSDHRGLRIPSALTSSELETQLNANPPSLEKLLKDVQVLLDRDVEIEFRDCIRGPSASAWFYMHSLDKAEAMLRWGLETYPAQAGVLRNKLAEVLFLGGNYEQSLAMSRALPLEGFNFPNRFIAKLALAQTRAELSDFENELDDAMNENAKSYRIGPGQVRDVMEVIRFIAALKQTGDHSGLEAQLDRIDGLPQEQMLRFLVLGMQHDMLNGF